VIIQLLYYALVHGLVCHRWYSIATDAFARVRLLRLHIRLTSAAYSLSRLQLPYYINLTHQTDIFPAVFLCDYIWLHHASLH